jgi:hypothetical protein
LSQKRQFFCWNFRRKYLKNHNIGPWLGCDKWNLNENTRNNGYPASFYIDDFR